MRATVLRLTNASKEQHTTQKIAAEEKKWEGRQRREVKLTVADRKKLRKNWVKGIIPYFATQTKQPLLP